MTSRLDGVLFLKMVKNGAANLEFNKNTVNDLNVFPVPDGDTGDNMSMTINAAAKTVKEVGNLEKVAEEVAKETLFGARGNSGVILSRIFAGISNDLKKEEASVIEFNYAMQSGVTEAYGAVSSPVEGTILTVLKDSVSFANARINTEMSFEEYFEDLVEEMKNSIQRTPELLPSLKEAGVVDSGGVGLLYIFEGMKDAILGKVLSFQSQEKTEKSTEEDFSLFTENSELEFGYCTELLLRLQNKKIDISSFELEELLEFLNSIGDSVVAFKDGSIVKIHAHTKTPGKIFDYCQKFGEFLKVKVENMNIQHSAATIQNNFNNFKSKPHKKYGIVTVANGDGIVKTFKELGCDKVIFGGQSMNPSTKDFLDAFSEINADTIFVFPNNKNIIMAAKQAAENYQGAEIRIIETKTIGEGYAAVSMFDSSLKNPDEITESLEETIKNVVTGQVSRASRNTEIDGIQVKDGDYIGFSGKEILTDNENREETLKELAKKLSVEKFDIAILIFGEDVGKETAEEMKKFFTEGYPRTEFYLIDGEQPIYDYILILE